MTKFMLDGALNPDLLEKLNSAGRVVLDWFEDLFEGRGASGKPASSRTHFLFR